MFKQFISNYTDSQIYLISSLWFFLAFFILVGVMLLMMKKSHVDYMSELPLKDEQDK
jgi:hypothetical protein